MGRVKDRLIEVQTDVKYARLAEALGLEVEDFMWIDWEVEPDTSRDGDVYGYSIIFPKDTPIEFLQRIDRLENGNIVHLEPWEWENDYDQDYDDQFEAIVEDKEYVQKYRNEIGNLEKLLDIEVSELDLKEILYRQIFIGIIGTLEAFLSDAFINLTFDNDEYFKNFIKTHPKFKEQKFELRDIFEEREKLEETAKKVMLDTIYHNLPVIAQMYRGAFNVDFPNISEIYTNVLKRHDLVHRNGRTKTGEYVSTDRETILDLIQKTNEFVDSIVDGLKAVDVSV